MSTDRLDAARRSATIPITDKSNRVSTAQSTSLPQHFEGAVPECARQCLAGYIEQGWTCSKSDPRCFCSKYSSQGFALGELAYICLQQECGQRTHEEYVKAYQICWDYGNAVTATHSTLTVPATTTTETRSAATTSQSAQTALASSISTRPADTLESSTSSTSAMDAGMLSATSATSSASTEAIVAAASRDGSGHPTSLSTAQATGISIACMGSVVLAIGLFYLVLCLRRRKLKVRDEKQERDSYDFVDDAPPRFSPFHYGHADPRGPLGGFYSQRAELMSEKRNSKWYREHFLAEPVTKYEKGFDFSPKSLQSRSTISQLLPDKPKATPPQLRLKPSPSLRPSSAFTQPTVFEEDRSIQMSSSMFPPPAGLPTNPKAFHYPIVAKPQGVRYTENFTQSPVSMRHPSLSIEIPKQAARVVKSPAQAHLPAPQLRNRSPVNQERTVSDARSSRSAASFLNYYTSPDPDALRSPESPTPIDDNIQTRRAVPTAITVTKPTYPPRAVRVTSGASDTSFESTDPDEPTPPDEEDKQLTPVKENSPIAGIKYPKVPRSSNQAIPRSPPIGARNSPSIGTKISPTPKPVRRPNALPAGAHARLSPRRTPEPQAFGSPGKQSAPPRPTSHIPRKPVPSYQPGHQPVTPERQVKQSSDLSGSTLAAKRRGEFAAHGLEKGLHIKNSAHSLRSNSSNDKPLPPIVPATKRSPHSSPLKGYGRVASRNNSPVATRPPGLPQGQPPPRQQAAKARYPVNPAQGTTGHGQPGVPAAGGGQQARAADPPIKSPLWEPKLTPSRKGEDLYLQVGSATPRTEAFERQNGSGLSYAGRGM